MKDKGPLILAVVAGLSGAAGVALAAVAAHKVQSSAIAIASQMLIVHAAATLALAAIAQRTQRGWSWLLAAALLSGGSVLFALSLVLPTLAGVSLFPLAAPTGGSTMIAGWLASAIAGILELRAARK